MTKVLVTGGTGQLGQALADLGQELEWQVHAPSHAEVPLEAADPARWKALIERSRPDWIIHAAAMTDVDGCERDPEHARQVNVEGTRALATAARDTRTRLAFLSTDYVFDGQRGNYAEADATAPLSAYGRSKLAAEKVVLGLLPDRAIIARTSVLFGPHKNNFVTWVQRSLKEGRTIRIAADQWVTPTLSADLARQLAALMQREEAGIWHTAGADRRSRLDMAQVIAAHQGADPSLIEAVAMKDLPFVAPRPRDSTLATQKIRHVRAPMEFSRSLDLLDQLRIEDASR